MRLYDITITEGDKQLFTSKCEQLILKGSSPIVVTELAIKNQNLDIFKAQEVYLYEIYNANSLVKDAEYTVTGKLVNNNQNYSITAIGKVVEITGVYKLKTLRLTNINGTKITEPVNYVSFDCNCDGAIIKPIKEDVKIDWNTFDLTADSYDTPITLKKGRNNIELPYGFALQTNLHKSEDGKSQEAIIKQISFIHADTSKWKRFMHFNRPNENTLVMDTAYLDTSSAIIFQDLTPYENLTDAPYSMDFNQLDFSTVQILSFKYFNGEIDVSNIDTGNVIQMAECFSDDTEITKLNLLKWKTDKVTDMSYMFSGCSNLTKLDLSGWNVNNVTRFYRMFDKCPKLEEIDLSGWDMKNGTQDGNQSIQEMFGADTTDAALKKVIVKNCSKHTLDLIESALNDTDYGWTYNGFAFIRDE